RRQQRGELRSMGTFRKSRSSKIGQGLQVRHFQVRFAGSSFDGSNAQPRRRAIDPDRSDPERLGWDDIMINALTNVQPLTARHAAAVLGHLEKLQARLVAACLL